MGRGKHLNPDVLGIIFEYYAEEETVESPLETLLLVCRSWNEAARSYRTIWSRIDVRIGCKYPIESHLAYSKRRLEYSGSSALLDITIKVCLDYVDTPSLGRMHRAACEILCILAGEDGAECHRWRSLNFDTGVASERSFTLVRNVEFSIAPLAYPMPSLESITLTHLKLPDAILPICPSLTSAEFVEVLFSSLPIMKALRMIKVSFQRYNADFSSLESSPLLEDLQIHTHYSRSVIFPKCLPSVKNLVISGVVRGNLNEVQMPNLNTLHLNSMARSDVFLSSVESLKISWEGIKCFIWLSIQSYLFRLLLEIPNLGKIDMPPILVARLLKYICDALSESKEPQEASPFHGRSVEINGQGVYISGNETVEEIVTIARALSLPPPTSSWQVIWEEITSTEWGHRVYDIMLIHS
jgi:hypothetical protein